MNRRGNTARGGGPGIPGWGSRADKSRDTDNRTPAGGAQSPVGNDNNTNTTTTKPNEPVESTVPNQIEAEVREEARQLCEEFVRDGMTPEAAKWIVRYKVGHFVKGFEPDKPVWRLDHSNPYGVSGLSQLEDGGMADMEMEMDMELGYALGTGMGMGGRRKGNGKGTGRGRRTGRGRGRGRGRGTAMAHIFAKPKPFRLLTRAECKAVDNIMQDTHESDEFETREQRFGGLLNRGFGGQPPWGWRRGGPGSDQGDFGYGPERRNWAGNMRGMGSFPARRMMPGFDMEGWGDGNGWSQLR